MIPAYIIALRESLEASLSVVTITLLLTRLGFKNMKLPVWFAAFLAAVSAFGLVSLGAASGTRFRELISGDSRETIEAVMTLLSALFITWAVVFLHRTFTQGKIEVLSRINAITEKRAIAGVFLTAFTAVFREGIEIFLFLATTYLTSGVRPILSGTFLGILSGILLSVLLVKTTLRLPVRYTFRVTTLLLILFAGGMVAGGAHTLNELGVLRETRSVMLPFVPTPGTADAAVIRTLFGLRRTMDLGEILWGMLYVTAMYWWIHVDRLIRVRATEQAA